MNIAQSLKKLMDDHSLSNSKLAREIHVHTSTVGNWLDGKDVKAENLETLCTYFGCSLDYLAGTEEPKKAPRRVSARLHLMISPMLFTKNQRTFQKKRRKCFLIWPVL